MANHAPNGKFTPGNSAARGRGRSIAQRFAKVSEEILTEDEWRRMLLRLLDIVLTAPRPADSIAAYERLVKSTGIERLLADISIDGNVMTPEQHVQVIRQALSEQLGVIDGHTDRRTSRLD